MIILNIPLFKGLTLEQIEDMKNKHCMTEKKYKKNYNYSINTLLNMHY
jgi:hypothetical protein